MTDQDHVLLSGAPGSPYTRKMLAVLRYRRIPYRVIFDRRAPGLPRPKVQLLPTFYFPDETGALQAQTDSTPLVRRLEREHAGRSVRPVNPALALIDALLEDYGDEWLTKAMFHYRWAFDADARHAGRLLPNWSGERLSDDTLAARAAYISERQIERLRYVGSNEVTGPVIEAGYARFLDAFENHLKVHPFLLGARPAACDFAAFGQLTQLTQVDPTPEAVARDRAPRVMAWVSGVEDLSGLEPSDADWLSADALPDTLTALIAEVGRVYAPLLLANARAARAGAAEVRAEIDGRPWVQQTYAYQVKCLGWLREEYAALDDAARRQVDRALAGTGCEALFVGA